MKSRLSVVLLLTGFFRFAAGADSDALLSAGLSLAGQGRLADARAELLRGLQIYPEDKRFLMELAGIAYREGRRHQAIAYLQRALALDAREPYANEALGALYLLEGNIPATLVYWNRIGKPRLNKVDIAPASRIGERLLARSVEARPGSTLRLEDLERTQANLRRIGAASGSRTQLVTQDGESYDFKLAIGGGIDWLRGPARLLPAVAGLPYQTLFYEFRVLPESAGRLETIFRWDPNKKLIGGFFAGVPGGNPHWLYRFGVEGRNENWDVREESSDTLFRLRQAGGAFELTRGFGSRLEAALGLSFAVRNYSDVIGAPPHLFSDGLKIKESTSLTYRVLRPTIVPLSLTVGAKADLGRVLTAPGAFSKIQMWTNGQRAVRNESLRFELGLSAGRGFGSVPFDELFQLGMERDNDLWLRGHVGTYQGRKGNAPLGTQYALLQSDAMQTIFRIPMLRLEAGPFIDSGIVSRAYGRLGSGGWLFDVGAESRIRVMNALTLVVVCGRDTRNGSTVVYTAVRR